MVRVTARTRDGTVVRCPGCGTPSRRVHSRYCRHVADLAVGGRSAVIDLSVRRLFCDVVGCPRRTFVERVEGVTSRYGRYTPALLELLQAVGLALAGSAGAGLPAALHVFVSRVTVPARLMALPDPSWETPEVLGVDDFSLRRRGLRDRPAGHGHPPRPGPAARTGSGSARRLTEGASGRTGDLPGPGRGLRRGRHPRRTGHAAGRGPAGTCSTTWGSTRRRTSPDTAAACNAPPGPTAAAQSMQPGSRTCPRRPSPPRARWNHGPAAATAPSTPCSNRGGPWRRSPGNCT